jgi:hypothetical protein
MVDTYNIWFKKILHSLISIILNRYLLKTIITLVVSGFEASFHVARSDILWTIQIGDALIQMNNFESIRSSSVGAFVHLILWHYLVDYFVNFVLSQEHTKERNAH